MRDVTLLSMKNKSVQNCGFVHHAKFHCIMTTLNKLFKIEFERGGTGKEPGCVINHIKALSVVIRTIFKNSQKIFPVSRKIGLKLLLFLLRFLYPTKPKNNPNWKNIFVVILRLVGKLCATCTVTGYPCYSICFLMT